MSSINEDLKLKILQGDPILLEKTNSFFIHRTIGEIIEYTYTDFLKIIQLFTISDSEIQSEMPIPGITTFFYFLLNLNNTGQLSTLIRQGFNFFIGAENIQIDLENKILYFSYKDIENIELTEEGFQEIVSYIKIIYNVTFLEEEKDLSEAERRMKEKFDKLRKQREAAKKQDDSRVNFSDMLGGFAVRNYNFDWYKVLQLPYYTFFFLLKKLRKYDDYELQLKARLAGADIKEELHHWLSGDDED